MGGKIENKERKSVGLRRRKRERKEKGEGSYPRRCSRRVFKRVFKGSVQRRCSFFYRVEKRGVLKL